MTKPDLIALFAAGLGFGIGLVVSGMANPTKRYSLFWTCSVTGTRRWPW